MDNVDNDWNVPYNSELTTIKNNEFIKGCISGFITGVALIILLWMVI